MPHIAFYSIHCSLSFFAFSVIVLALNHFPSMHFWQISRLRMPSFAWNRFPVEKKLADGFKPLAFVDTSYLTKVVLTSLSFINFTSGSWPNYLKTLTPKVLHCALLSCEIIKWKLRDCSNDRSRNCFRKA